MVWVLYVCVIIGMALGSSGVTTGGCFELDIHYVGLPLMHDDGNNNYGATGDAQGCQALCQNTDGCEWFIWEHADSCLLTKGKGNSISEKPGDVTGPKYCKTDSAVVFLGPGAGDDGYSTYLSLPDLALHYPRIMSYPIQEPSEHQGISSAVAAFIDEKIMVCGGQTPYAPPQGAFPSNNCYTLTDWAPEEYTPKFNTTPDMTDWEDWTPAPSMRMKRTEAAGTYTEDGWWVTGGRNDRSTEMLVNGHWVLGPELPTAMFGHCLFRVNSDQYLLTGGVTEMGESLTDTLDMSSPSYLLKNGVYYDVEGGPLVFGQACAMLGEDAYVVGGVSALTKEGTSEVHIWSEGEWKEGPELPIPIFGSSLVAYQDHLYLLGGITGKDHEYIGNGNIYKLDQGTWTADVGTEYVHGLSFPALVVPQK